MLAVTEESLGAIAATGTAFCWALAALFFTNAARRVGQFSLNQIRLVIAIVLLSVACGFVGAFIHVPMAQAGLLAVSGIAGLTLGDAAYFYALQVIGPRRGALVLSLHPIFTALLAIPLLGEQLTWIGVLGMIVTLAGVAWVVLERGQPGELHGSLWLGILGAAVGAVGQAVGAILAKVGLGAGAGSWLDVAVGLDVSTRVAIHPFFGTWIRMVSGFIPLIAFAVLRGALPRTIEAARNGKAMSATLGGAVFGPFIGVSLSLYALTKIDSYIAATLFATAPVMVIPLVRIFYKQVITPRAFFGALVACAGVAMLTLRDRIAALL
jgi:drug/metabolite transporter (DMT)-like permease